MNETDNAANSHIGGAGLRCTLLVIGSEETFSDMLMDYAIGMAQRMKYCILAVNLHIAQSRRRRYLSSEDAKDELNELKERCKKSVEVFREKAAEADVIFESDFRFGELDDVVRDIYAERSDIDLVLIEPDYVREDEEGPFSIPAFTLASNGF